MTAFLAVVVAAAVCVLGYCVGWWHCNRRWRTDVAALRLALGDQVQEANRAADDAYDARDQVKTRLDACEVELDRMTADRDRYRDAHERSAAEFEHLLEVHRAVPEAFRAPLGHLDRDRAPAVLLFDEWPMPDMDAYTREAAHLASILDERTDVWARVTYRPPAVPVPNDGEVHEGEVLPPAGRALVPTRTYPAKPQRHGKRGKR